MSSLTPNDADADAVQRRLAAAAQLADHVALQEVRTTFDGPLMLLKGLEIAAHYPNPSDRSSGDIDLLTSEPIRLQHTLLDMGFDYLDAKKTDTAFPYADPSHQHLAPLRHTSLPVVIEVHRSPGWIPGMKPPTTRHFLNTGVPSATNIGGLLAPFPPYHAVYIAVHSWRHRPFNRTQDLTDISVMLKEPDTLVIAEEVAVEWGVSRIWELYTNAIAARSKGDRARLLVRILGGAATSELARTKRSDHLSRLFGTFLVDQPVQSIASLLAHSIHQVGRLPGEDPRNTLLRATKRLISKE